jgi:radical SAM protein with 4Fe4S-binding SPASM domain
MPVDMARNLLATLAPARPFVHLYGWGEPLLHPEILTLVEASLSHDIPTLLSTNLNCRDHDLISALARSGLQRIRVSIDAATSETYAQVRCGGDFDLVMDGTRRLLAARGEAPRPIIEWAFVVVRENEHEIHAFQGLATEMGVDQVRFKTMTLYSGPGRESSLPTSARLHAYELPAGVPRVQGERCVMPFEGCAITAAGDVYPCSMCSAERSWRFGNVRFASFHDIWNSAEAQAMRQQMNADPAAMHVCRDCPHAVHPIKDDGWHRWIPPSARGAGSPAGKP